MGQRIHVQRNDIALGLQQESTVCAIAVAMKRQNPHWQRIKVTGETIRYTDVLSGERVTVATPPKAAKFVDVFDHGKENAHPFMFELPADPIKVEPVRYRQPSELIAQTVKAAERRRNGYVPTRKSSAGSTRRELRNN